MCLILLGQSAYAQSFKDWWVDIKNDRVTKVRYMLEQGMDPNELSPNGQPAIMYAIREQAWNVYDFLANNKKTALNAININKETPLMYLAVVGETKRAQELIDKGALVNRPDANWTALHYAASTAKVDTVQMLIKNGAYVNALASDGTTPLMMAAYAGSDKTVQVLLDAGANLHLKSAQGYSVVDWAMLKSHTRLAQKIQNLTDLQMGIEPEPESAQFNLDTIELSNENAVTDSKTSKYFDLDRFDAPVSP